MANFVILSIIFAIEELLKVEVIETSMKVDNTEHTRDISRKHIEDLNCDVSNP